MDVNHLYCISHGEQRWYFPVLATSNIKSELEDWEVV